MDATVRAPGSTATHSAAAYSPQCVSCSRHGRPSTHQVADDHRALRGSAAGVMGHHPPQVPRPDGPAVCAVGAPSPSQLGWCDVAQHLAPSSHRRRRPFMDDVAQLLP
eukprot:1017792-Alexandrium_andersonii.AAC.1